MRWFSKLLASQKFKTKRKIAKNGEIQPISVDKVKHSRYYTIEEVERIKKKVVANLPIKVKTNEIALEIVNDKIEYILENNIFIDLIDIMKKSIYFRRTFNDVDKDCEDLFVEMCTEYIKLPLEIYFHTL